MRVATMVIALVLMLVVFVQSCAVSVGGSIGEDEDMAGGGGLGILLAISWAVGAGLVLGKPKAAIWAFGIGGMFGLIGATAGAFPDLWIWTVVSVIFGLMSWRGIKEPKTPKLRHDTEQTLSLPPRRSLVATGSPNLPRLHPDRGGSKRTPVSFRLSAERRLPESNWCKRLCRPLRSHSAKAPNGTAPKGRPGSG